MIGATRPSIADPFLPRKIEEGRIEDIRECIGCNICVSTHFASVNFRCTQNPSAGEEWRRDWHPERIPSRGSEQAVLVVGAGPAGLEAARALGQRGYAVTLAEGTRTLGGRVTREARLPGLAEWARVRDWRVTQIEKMDNVEVYLESELAPEHVHEFAAPCVVLATGARWRGDGVGRIHNDPIPGIDAFPVVTPDAVMDGELPTGPVLVYDDDHYYLASLMAEILARAGRDTLMVTPASDIAEFTRFTLEHDRIARRLHEAGVEMLTHHRIDSLGDGEVVLRHVLTDRDRRVAAASLVPVTARLPLDALYHRLMKDPAALEANGIRSVTRIGDCLAPGAIVHATFAGHRYARELDTAAEDRLLRHELPSL